MIVRLSFPYLLLLLLLPLLKVALADDSLYEDFLPSNDPNEPEWALSSSSASLDLVDTAQIEYPFELSDLEVPQDIASTGRPCGFVGGQALNRLRPRGDDDFCTSNLGDIQLPTIIPNLSTLKLDTFCPNKFGPFVSNLVCASKDPEKMKPSIFTSISLEDAEPGIVFISSESCVAST